MEFDQIVRRALAIRERIAQFEQSQYGRTWSSEELALGFVGDVGDLAKLVTAKNGVRNIPQADEKLAHELGDCLWSIIVLAHVHHIDLEQAFMKTMDELEVHFQGYGQ
jgi:NTP pyrophosphatase (non-canonical NTP hydrolase)